MNCQGWLIGNGRIRKLLTRSEWARWSLYLRDKILRIVLIVNILVELLYHLMGPFILVVDLLQFSLLFLQDVLASEILICGGIDSRIISSLLEELHGRLCRELALMYLVPGGILV